MSVKELKALLRQHGVSYQGCCEKADLQEKARVALAPAATRTSMGTSGAPVVTVAFGSSDGAFVSSSGVGASFGTAGPFIASATASGSSAVAGMSTKEIRERLTQLNVTTVGCIERQDLVDRLTSALQKQEADPDYAPTLKQGLGPPMDPSAVNDMFAAVTEILSKDDEKVRVQYNAVHALISGMRRNGNFPPECSLEFAMQLMVSGEDASERTSGLRFVKPFLENMASHPVRRAVADLGLLRETVRLLQDSDSGLRLEALDMVTIFTRSPSLSAKVWSYGAMEAIQRELTRPTVLAALESRNPDVVGRSAKLSGPVRVCLCLLADMLWPAHVEGHLVGTTGKKIDPSEGLSDEFTAKLCRWMDKHGVLEQIGRLMTIVRVGGWTGKWQEGEANSVPMHALRVLLLMRDKKLIAKVMSLPGLAESLVYLIEQWESAPPEATSATSLLAQLRGNVGHLTEFLTRDEYERCIQALRASTKIPPPASAPPSVAASHKARASLADCLYDDVGSWRYPPKIALAKFWRDRLLDAPDTDEAERIVKNLLGHEHGLLPMVTDKQLYELEFWPDLARVAVRAGSARQFLLITFSEAFNLHPEAGDIPLEPGMERLWTVEDEDYRPKIILQLLKALVATTLEPATNVDESAVHVMHFFLYIAKDVKPGSPLAKALLNDRDLMPFLLRVGLLEDGCSMAVALAKLVLLALFQLNPNAPHRKDLPKHQFALSLCLEDTPGLGPDSFRYNYNDGIIYVGARYEPEACELVPTFISNGQKLIAEYNELHPDRPYVSRDFDRYDLSKSKEYKPRPPKRSRQCAVCTKSPAKSKCARCQETVYCGKECQLKDWPSHKLTCQKKKA